MQMSQIIRDIAWLLSDGGNLAANPLILPNPLIVKQRITSLLINAQAGLHWADSGNPIAHLSNYCWSFTRNKGEEWLLIL